MFFILSKALLFILSPFFWIVLCFAFFLYIKTGKWKKRMKWTGIFIFVFFSNSFIFSEFCRLWEMPGTPISNVKQHDVAIVLGGMFEYNSDLDNLSIRREGDRFIQAVTLYKENKVRKILISGDSGYLTDRGLHEAKQIKELLIKWGIPESDILTEEKSINTHLNAKMTKSLLDRSYPEFSSFILITSGIHMKRALACFDKEGLKCTPFSTDLYSNQTRNYFWNQYIIPSIDNFIQWNKLLKETFGYISYAIVGYI